MLTDLDVKILEFIRMHPTLPLSSITYQFKITEDVAKEALNNLTLEAML